MGRVSDSVCVSVYLCVCLSVFPLTPVRWYISVVSGSIKLKFGGKVENTHISILGKFIMLAFIIMSKNRHIVKGNNSTKELIGSSYTALCINHLVVDKNMHNRSAQTLSAYTLLNLWLNIIVAYVILFLLQKIKKQ